jgi:hypothetical protein
VIVVVIERDIDPILLGAATASGRLVVLASGGPGGFDGDVGRGEGDQAAEVDVCGFGVGREGEGETRCYQGVEVGVERAVSVD